MKLNLLGFKVDLRVEVLVLIAVVGAVLSCHLFGACLRIPLLEGNENIEEPEQYANKEGLVEGNEEPEESS